MSKRVRLRILVALASEANVRVLLNEFLVRSFRLLTPYRLLMQTRRSTSRTSRTRSPLTPSPPSGSAPSASPPWPPNAFKPSSSSRNPKTVRRPPSTSPPLLTQVRRRHDRASCPRPSLPPPLSPVPCDRLSNWDHRQADRAAGRRHGQGPYGACERLLACGTVRG